MAEERRGRPRQFDETDVLDRAVETFWSFGAAGTTTRILESRLGLKQSSIYNTFGSKQRLLERSLDHYLHQVEDALLGPMCAEGAGAAEIGVFIDDLVEWISDADHPGCLMLNLAAEERTDPVIAERARVYRGRLRDALAAALDGASKVDVNAVLAGVLGLNLAAATGASRAELGAMAQALNTLVTA